MEKSKSKPKEDKKVYVVLNSNLGNMDEKLNDYQKEGYEIIATTANLVIMRIQDDFPVGFGFPENGGSGVPNTMH